MVQYNKILPFHDNVTIKTQMGWNPISVVHPTKESKLKWKDAYFKQDKETEQRRSDETSYLTSLKFSEFHAGFCENLIRYWSLKNSIIVDPFAGRATRAVVSSKLGRQYYGYEISKKTVERSLDHYKQLKLNPMPTLHHSNGCLMTETKDSFADMILTCPPYWNIEKYETCDGQLSDEKSYDSFLKNIEMCGNNMFRVLKNGAFCLWICADFRAISGESCFHCFHNDCINTFKKVGFNIHDIVIMENISPFSSLQCAKVASKRYTSKVHEYLLVFRKPGTYIVPEYCELDSINEKSEDFFE